MDWLFHERMALATVLKAVYCSSTAEGQLESSLPTEMPTPLAIACGVA
jgi:hypothetical protein